MMMRMDPFGGFGMFEVMFFVVFAIIVGIFVVMLLRGVLEWNRNNHSPRLTVAACVVSKRMDVHHSRNSGGRTWYYVTFQVESGDRIELSVSGEEYGMLAEGDGGMLTFQGTRYVGFERN